MKKILTAILLVTMSFALVACGKNNDTNKETTTNNEAAGSATIAPEFTEGSAGEALWNAFLTMVTDNEAATPEEIANALVTNKLIQFKGGAMAVEPGLLKGFKTEIKDFTKGAVYEPMMGSIAFIGYVFELADGADVKAFMSNLKDNSNPAWNVCVQADHTMVGAHENKVFFLMYPSELFAESGNNAGADAAIIEPDVAADTIGATLWNEFKVVMAENPEAKPEEVAFGVAWHEAASQFGATAMKWEMEFFPGIAAETFTGYKSAASFSPMMGSVAFAGYIFELEEGADVEAFIADLKAKADPAWNICTVADQVVIGAYNNKVFFLMCPATAEQQPADEL